MERKSPAELQEHMLWTYYGLRVGLASIGVFLPLVVLITGGVLHRVWLAPSISDYYHLPPQLSYLTTRDLLVGGLFAAAACLYLYKGYSNKENIALNLAAIFAVGVALFPTALASAPRTLVSSLHNASALLFFACIAYVSLFRSRDTLPLLPVAERAAYRRRYLWTGIAMIVSPVAALIVSFALEPASESRTLVFWLESLAVWTFAAYWIVKTFEMRRSAAEREALDAELERRVVPAEPAAEGAPGQPMRAPAGQVECVVPAAKGSPP